MEIIAFIYLLAIRLWIPQLTGNKNANMQISLQKQGIQTVSVVTFSGQQHNPQLISSQPPSFTGFIDLRGVSHTVWFMMAWLMRISILNGLLTSTARKVHSRLIFRNTRPRNRLRAGLLLNNRISGFSPELTRSCSKPRLKVCWGLWAAKARCNLDHIVFLFRALNFFTYKRALCVKKKFTLNPSFFFSFGSLFKILLIVHLSQVSIRFVFLAMWSLSNAWPQTFLYRSQIWWAE